MPGDDNENIIPLAEARRRDAKPPAPSPADRLDESEFRPLGHNHGNYFFLARRSGQIVESSGRNLTNEGTLLGLAPLTYWEMNYPKKGGFDKSAAINELIQTCLKRGVFNVDRIRGRGAWIDNKRVILHLGDHLVVDGERAAVSSFDTEFIYEEAASFGISPGARLTTADGQRFLELCEMLRWERPYMATIFAGWCVVAPICGALAWRPHLWLIGAPGSGKSWIQNNVVERALAGIALSVQSKTTEAGLRQALRSDARPVIFDEAEAEGIRDRDRLQQIIDLARAASTEQGAAIAKGGQDGKGQQYRPRFSACFSSIAPSLTHQADESRFTVLSLLGAENGSPETKAVIAEHFDLLRDAAGALLTRDFSIRLLSRSIALLAIIRANAETYATAAAEIMPSRRDGDQIGAMLAGAASLHHSRTLTLPQARESIVKLGWLDQAAIEASTTPTHVKLLSFITQQTVTLRLGNATVYERTFGDLIAIAAKASADQSIGRDDAETYLRRHGMKVQHLNRAALDVGAVAPYPGAADGPYVWFANLHDGLARLLKSTAWAVSWHVHLANAPGAIKSRSSIKFGHGLGSRAIAVPFDQVDNSE